MEEDLKFLTKFNGKKHSSETFFFRSNPKTINIKLKKMSKNEENVPDNQEKKPSSSSQVNILKYEEIGKVKFTSQEVRPLGARIRGNLRKVYHRK